MSKRDLKIKGGIFYFLGRERVYRRRPLDLIKNHLSSEQVFPRMGGTSPYTNDVYNFV